MTSFKIDILSYVNIWIINCSKIYQFWNYNKRIQAASSYNEIVIFLYICEVLLLINIMWRFLRELSYVSMLVVALGRAAECSHITLIGSSPSTSTPLKSSMLPLLLTTQKTSPSGQHYLFNTHTTTKETFYLKFTLRTENVS